MLKAYRTWNTPPLFQFIHIDRICCKLQTPIDIHTDTHSVTHIHPFIGYAAVVVRGCARCCHRLPPLGRGRALGPRACAWAAVSLLLGALFSDCGGGPCLAKRTSSLLDAFRA